MPYEIIFAPEAVADLQRLKAHIRAIVRAALQQYLRHQPEQVSKSRIKRLRGMTHPQYRLRVDEIRVYYDVGQDTVDILAIVDKNEADDWLTQFGAGDETDTTFGSEE
ncbi:MAG: type II toxin-antitoxin system RelE/ParE family toxin [Roseiflexaceae bacterium]